MSDVETYLDRTQDEIDLEYFPLYRERLKQYQYSSLKSKIPGLKYFDEFLKARSLDENQLESNHFKWWADYVNNRVSESTAKNYFYSAIQYLRYAGVLDYDEYEQSEAHKQYNQIQTNKEIETRKQDIQNWFTREQMEQMCEETDIFRDEVLIRFLYHTGARKEECVSTKVDDVDLVDRSIEIETAKRDDYHTRTIVYPPEFSEYMRKWIREARQNYVYADDSPYLLLSKGKRQIDKTYIRHRVVELAEAAGFQKELYEDESGATQYAFTPMEFRKGWIMRHLEAEMPTPFVSELAGHSQLETTEQYITTSDEQLREMQEKYRPD